MKQITESVYQVGSMVNVFILAPGDGSLVLVDTGIPGMVKDILRAIDELGYTPQDVSHILLTHADPDHVGGLAALKQATGAPALAGELAARYIEAGAMPPHIPKPLAAVSGPFMALMLTPTPVEQTVTDGAHLEVAGGIQVIATPGHTEGSLSFLWEPGGVLFAGDLFMGGSISPDLMSWSVEAGRESARRVLALNPNVIAMGHGDPMTAAQREKVSADV